MVYFDNASTTKMYKEALDVFNECNEKYFFNPGALYRFGADNLSSIENSRKTFLNLLHADKFDNIIFTSGATEANNMAIMGCLKNKNSKMLFSVGEHPSVYNVACYLKSQGYNVDFIKITPSGNVDFDDFREKMTEDVSFVSIMHVSNETGVINDIQDLCSYAKKINKNVVFHSDGVQAFGKIDVNIAKLGVDLYTISAHKIHGPKGVGALFVSKNIKIKPLIHGGEQEKGLRSGTENYPGIKSFEKSAEISINSLNKRCEIFKNLNNHFKTLIAKLIPEVSFNGEAGSNHIISFSLPNTKAETLLHMLDDEGVLISNGSACSTKKSGNRILSNMGIKKELVEASLRVSFDEFNTIEEIDFAVDKITNVYKKYLDLVKR